MRGFPVVLVALLVAYGVLSARSWRVMVDGRSHQARIVGRLADGDPRALRPLALDPDGYTWHTLVDVGRRSGVSRVRWADFDHAPSGREVHWSSSVPWLIRLVNVPAGVDDGAGGFARSWLIGPLLRLGFLAVAAAIAYSASGAVAGAAVVALGMWNESLDWAFHPLRVDHHGLQVTAAVVLLAPLAAAGWGVGGRVRRRFFVLSALGGGVGLWLGASVFVPLLVIAGVASAVVGSAVRGKSADDSGREAWELWGRVGAVASLVLYVVEYAPRFPWERMEVNHPAYALAWWGGGILLGELRRGLERMRGARVVSALALLALPFAWLALGWGSHAYFDPVGRRMHAFILEFRSFVEAHGDAWPVVLGQTCGALPVALLLVGFLALRPRAGADERMRALGACNVLAGLSALVLAQDRWLPLAAGVLLVLVPVLLGAVRSSLVAVGDRRILNLGWVCIGLTVLGWGYLAVKPPEGGVLGDGLDPALTKAALIHRVCLQVREAVGTAPAIVLCDPSLAPALTYFTGIPTVGSLYWENTAGMAALAGFLASLDDQAARSEAAARGWTHVLVGEDQILDENLAFVAHGSRDPLLVRRTLAYRLIRQPAALPAWIELDPVATARIRQPVSAGGGFLTNRMLLYRLNP